MSFLESFDAALAGIGTPENSGAALLERISVELKFAKAFAELHPDKEEKWQGLILKAAELVCRRLSEGGPVDLAALVNEAEKIMAPIGKAAKEYTVHCCGHAHIDMNWLWPYEETVNITHDTFLTVDRLMTEFPAFHFSQDQTSVYEMMERHCPEVFEMIKRRVKEGRWEVAASMWVEGDKNMASGEILCRHILYTKRYFAEKFGIPYDDLKLDWECDTFGHCHSLPSILNRGGVTHYYHARTGPYKWLYWWKAPDGSKVLAFHDCNGYNGRIAEYTVRVSLPQIKERGVKNLLFSYGVGDHGGGPTRSDLLKAAELDSWPIYPHVLLSTREAYFAAVEKEKPDLPVHDGELNFAFRGCYSSESNIKLANRVSENILPEIEVISLVAGAAAGFPYPTDKINDAWQKAMFSQFHDILPGSGLPETYQYAQGMFQDIKAIAASVRTRALRSLASQIDTASAWGLKPPTGSEGCSIGDGLGAGAGHCLPGGVTSRGAGSNCAEPVVVFNQLPFARSEMVRVGVWNRDIPFDRVRVRDDAGGEVAGQVVETHHYWGHEGTIVMFPAKDVPGAGFRTYTVDTVTEPLKTEGVTTSSIGVFENEYLKVEVDLPSGAVKHLIDKASGYDYVPEGELLGMLEFCMEAHHGMSAWELGRLATVHKVTDDGHWLEYGPAGGSSINLPLEPFFFKAFPSKPEQQMGPHRAAVIVSHDLGQSRVWVEIGLSAGSRMVEFKVTAHWKEIGTKATGVPMLRMVFPAKVADPKATYEIPFGTIERPVDGEEVPALKWADVSGKSVGAKGSRGITVLNSCKYGHSTDGNTMRVTLIRSSYEPDPIPELGIHEISFAVMPHEGMCPASEAARQAAAFNLPMNVVGTDVHKGKLPSSKGYAEVLTPNVMVAAIKKAEDSKKVVVRLYETEGKAAEARVRITDLVKPGAPAVECDLLERPLSKSTAKMEGSELVVKIPAHGIVSVLVG